MKDKSMNKKFLALSMFSLMTFSGDVLVGFTKTKHIGVMEFGKEFQKISDDYKVIAASEDESRERDREYYRELNKKFSCRNMRSSHEAYAIFSAKQDVLIRQMSYHKSGCSGSVLSSGFGCDATREYRSEFWKVIMLNFLQSVEESDKAKKLVGDYNRLHEFSDVSEHALCLDGDDFSKKRCFLRDCNSSRYEHNGEKIWTPGILIAIREKCNQDFSDSMKCLEAHNNFTSLMME